MKQLNAEDRDAVDLLLDPSDNKNTNRVLPRRLEAADKVLRLLSTMPASDPSTDIVDKTLQRVEDAANRSSPVPTGQPGVFAPRPAY